MYTNTPGYQKNMFRKVLAMLVAICMFTMLLWITTAVVVTLVNSSRSRTLNETFVDKVTFSNTLTESMEVTGNQRTTAAHHNFTITASKQTPVKHHTITSRSSTTTLTTGAATDNTKLRSTQNLSSFPSDTSSETKSTLVATTTIISVPDCLQNNADKIIPKSCWAEKDDVTKGCWFMLSKHLTQVVVSQTQTSNCHSIEKCLKLLRMIMSNHLHQNYRDINYNFLITGDGRIYEGRSWTCKVENNLEPSSKTIHVALTGNPADEATDQQINSLQGLVDFGNRNGYFKYNYKVKPYCCVIPSDNPDRYTFDLIKKLPKFYSNCNILNCKWKD